MEKVFKKDSEVYNITYTTGSGKDARTFRYQIGQIMYSLKACIYEIRQQHIRNRDGEITFNRFIIYIYSYNNNEIIAYKQVSNYDELSFNIEYLRNNE